VTGKGWVSMGVTKPLDSWVKGEEPKGIVILLFFF
jgi:hypothetical protein